MRQMRPSARLGGAILGLSGPFPETSHRFVVRRMTGSRPADIELNPLHPWSIRVNGGAWNVRLLLTGLEIR